MLEPIDIQHANEHLCPTCSLTSFPRQTFIHNRDQPFKQTRINKLCDTVPHCSCLHRIQRGDNLFGARRNLLLDCPLFEVRQGYTKKAGGELKSRICVVNVAVGTGGGDLDIPEMQEGRKEFEDGPLFLHTDTDSG